MSTPDDLDKPHLLALDFTCPTCGALGGQPCTNKTGEPVKPHAKRGGPNAA